jgi:hypothetical protein
MSCRKVEELGESHPKEDYTMDNFAKDLKWYAAIFALVGIVWMMVDRSPGSSLIIETGEHKFALDLNGESGQISMKEIIEGLLINHPNGINAAEATLKGPFKITPPGSEEAKQYKFVNIEQESLINELNKLSKNRPNHPVVKMLQELSDTHQKDSIFAHKKDKVLVYVDSSLQTNNYVKTCDDRYEAREVTLYSKNENRDIASSFAMNATPLECLKYTDSAQSSVILISEQTRKKLFSDVSAESALNGIEAGIFASPKGYILKPNTVAKVPNTLIASGP